MPNKPPPTISYDPERLIDRTITVDTFTDHIRTRTPFCHLRYGDGEFASALRILKGSNCDHHKYYHDTMGVELCEILREVGEAKDPHVYVGLHCTWHQERIQPWLFSEGLVGNGTKETSPVRWIGNIELQVGLESLRTLRFLEAVRDYKGFVGLVGNKNLAGVASGLGAHHFEIPKRNCFEVIGDVERRIRCHLHDFCEDRWPPIILCSASMASECLLWRLWSKTSDGGHAWAMLIDTGHIFDAMIGKPSRRYTKGNKGGVMDVIREHYAPLFR